MKNPLLILLLLLFSTSFGQNGKNKPLLFDGLYETACKVEKGDDEGSVSYLRFYADGTVISIGTDCEGTIEELKDWFHKNANQISKGTYKISGRKISFSTTGTTGTVHFIGQLMDNNIIRIKWKSSINRESGREKYKFIQLADLKN